MKAVFHTGVPAAWGEALGDRPWCLAPVGGKPLIEYWLEWAADLGVADVRVVLGDGADEVEAYCGDGSRWGLKVAYGFLRDPTAPRAYLRRSPRQWLDGLLYVCGPVFPRRLTPLPWPKPEAGTTYRLDEGADTVCLLSDKAPDIQAFLDGAPLSAPKPWSALALDPFPVRDIKAYYDLNMSLVGGDRSLYVPPGYLSRDGACIGYNVVIPPSVELRPPFSIGNDCRICPMAVIGPNAVIGNHVIVDRQTELADCIVLDGTYLGRNLEIKGKIVSGSRVVSVAEGVAVDIAEPWLLAQLESRARVGDAARAAVGWALAVGLVLLQAIPFAVLYPLVRLWGVGGYCRSERLGRGGRTLRLPVWLPAAGPSRLGRLFVGLGLDLFPLLVLAALGRLWLCGHAPLHAERDQALRQALHSYFPAAIAYHTRRGADGDRAAAAADALYYERYRSLAADVRLVARTLMGRFLDALAGEPVCTE